MVLNGRPRRAAARTFDASVREDTRARPVVSSRSGGFHIATLALPLAGAPSSSMSVKLDAGELLGQLERNWRSSRLVRRLKRGSVP